MTTAKAIGALWARNALRMTICLACFVVAFLFVQIHMPVDMEYADPATPIVQGESPAERLFEKAGCWNGEMEPKVEGIPPHVLISTPGTGPHLAGSKMVGKALEQIFEGMDHGLTIHGFCK